MATARLQYRKNGGALHEDSIQGANGDVISLTAASFAGWQRARFEIVGYPSSFACPSGWSTDASSGYYYYLANSGPSGVTPPDVTLPSSPDWGTWLFQLTVNSTIRSAKIGVEIRSPTLDLHETATGESAQFGDTRGYVGPEQENLHKLDTAATAAAGTEHILVDSATTAFINGVKLRAVATTVNVVGASTVTPMTFGYYRAAGGFGRITAFRRVILGGTGAPDLSTGGYVDFTIPNDAAMPAEITQVRLRPVLTAISGADLTTDFEVWLVNAGTLTPTFTLHADGSVTATGAITAGDLLTDGTIDTVSAQALPIGPTTATSVDLGAAAIPTNVLGDLVVTGDVTASSLSTGLVHSNVAGLFSSSLLVNADVDGAAAVAGTKISPDFGAQNITTTGSITAGASGFIGPKWDRSSAGPLTLGETNGTGLVFSGLPVTKCISVTSDAALGLGSGAGDLTLTIVGGDEVHAHDDDAEIVHTWGAYGFTRERRKHVTSSNATPQTILTFTIPASCSGTLLLRGRQVDVTGGASGNDRAYYERKIEITRRNSGAAVTAVTGVDVVSQSDTTWSCTFDIGSLPDVSVRLVGDASNQVEHDVTLIAEYQLFTPA